MRFLTKTRGRPTSVSCWGGGVRLEGVACVCSLGRFRGNQPFWGGSPKIETPFPCFGRPTTTKKLGGGPVPLCPMWLKFGWTLNSTVAGGPKLGPARCHNRQKRRPASRKTRGPRSLRVRLLLTIASLTRVYQKPGVVVRPPTMRNVRVSIRADLARRQSKRCLAPSADASALLKGRKTHHLLFLFSPFEDSWKTKLSVKPFSGFLIFTQDMEIPKQLISHNSFHLQLSYSFEVMARVSLEPIIAPGANKVYDWQLRLLPDFHVSLQESFKDRMSFCPAPACPPPAQGSEFSEWLIQPLLAKPSL